MLMLAKFAGDTSWVGCIHPHNISSEMESGSLSIESGNRLDDADWVLTKGCRGCEKHGRKDKAAHWVENVVSQCFYKDG